MAVLGPSVGEPDNILTKVKGSIINNYSGTIGVTYADPMHQPLYLGPTKSCCTDPKPCKTMWLQRAGCSQPSSPVPCSPTYLSCVSKEGHKEGPPCRSGHCNSLQGRVQGDTAQGVTASRSSGTMHGALWALTPCPLG